MNAGPKQLGETVAQNQIPTARAGPQSKPAKSQRSGAPTSSRLTSSENLHRANSANTPEQPPQAASQNQVPAAPTAASSKPAKSQRSTGAPTSSRLTPSQSQPSKSDKPITNRRSGERSVSCPPYNPGLHELVQGKQSWADPLDAVAEAQGFLGWHQRGYLPHRDAPGLTQFVTFRLHDSMPASRRGEWEALLRIEDNRQRRLKLEEFLDRGHGECWLRQPAIAGLAESALRHFDGERYQLLAWVVMPNHVHVLVEIGRTPLARVLQSWKGFIAREANKLLRREGTFWEHEYWDTYMRDDDQSAKARRYIEQNPVRAQLVREAKAWPWSSARFRDNYGKLVLSPEAVSRLQAGAPAVGAADSERRLSVGLNQAKTQRARA